MARSTHATGAYFKGKTVKWLEARGYQVAYLERIFPIWRGSHRGYVKRDQYGADLEAMSLEGIRHVQVKGGATARSGLAAARKLFAQFSIPAGVEQWIAIWLPRAREPEIEVVRVGPAAATEATIRIPTRRRSKRPVPLFDQPSVEY